MSIPNLLDAAFIIESKCSQSTLYIWSHFKHILYAVGLYYENRQRFFFAVYLALNTTASVFSHAIYIDT